MDPAYCGHCGERTDAHDHGACAAARVLDPPRYCPRCGRRMTVKITPDRWTATCSRHGPTPGASPPGATPPG